MSTIETIAKLKQQLKTTMNAAKSASRPEFARTFQSRAKEIRKQIKALEAQLNGETQ
jgi:hypothetical protein